MKIYKTKDYLRLLFRTIIHIILMIFVIKGNFIIICICFSLIFIFLEGTNMLYIKYRKILKKILKNLTNE